MRDQSISAIISRIESRKDRAARVVASLKENLENAEAELEKSTAALEVFQEEADGLANPEPSRPVQDMTNREWVLKALEESGFDGVTTRDLSRVASDMSGKELNEKAVGNALTDLKRQRKVERGGRKWYVAQPQETPAADEVAKEVGPGNAARPLTPNLQKGGDA